jgi:hypothetical protein
LAFALISLPGSAATITLDENGHGDADGIPLLFTATGQNPNVPNQSPVLIYTLPFSGTAGDVLLTEPESNIPGDVLQFLGDGRVIFYSKHDGDNSLAERFFPPIFPFPVANTVTLTETGSPGNDGATYTPTSGQPGFDSSGPSYHFISDSTVSGVPEPAALSLLLFGAGALAIAKLRRR